MNTTNETLEVGEMRARYKLRVDTGKGSLSVPKGTSPSGKVTVDGIDVRWEGQGREITAIYLETKIAIKTQKVDENEEDVSLVVDYDMAVKPVFELAVYLSNIALRHSTYDCVDPASILNTSPTLLPDNEFEKRLLSEERRVYSSFGAVLRVTGPVDFARDLPKYNEASRLALAHYCDGLRASLLQDKYFSFYKVVESFSTKSSEIAQLVCEKAPEFTARRVASLKKVRDLVAHPKAPDHGYTGNMLSHRVILELGSVKKLAQTLLAVEMERSS